MIWQSKRKMIFSLLLIALLAGVNAAPASAQKANQGDVEKLRREVAKLREELDDALREIRILKATIRAVNAAPENGPRYRGQTARFWLEQLKDTDPKSRADAVEAIGGFAQKDKKLIPVLIDTLKNDADSIVVGRTVIVLGAVGPEALPELIEIAKDKDKKIARMRAIEAIGSMGAKAKLAVPTLINALGDKHIGVLRNTVSALAEIGPEAKAAVPALVDALAESFADAGKPEAEGSRFGGDYYSINYRIFRTVRRLDPDLVRELRAPEPALNDGMPTVEFLNQWQRLHATMVKRYVDRK